MSGVATVTTAGIAQDTTHLITVSTSDAVSPAGQELVRTIRARFPVQVAGTAAVLVDSQRAISDRLPAALAVIAAATLVRVASHPVWCIEAEAPVVLDLFDDRYDGHSRLITPAGQWAASAMLHSRRHNAMITSR